MRRWIFVDKILNIAICQIDMFFQKTSFTNAANASLDVDLSRLNICCNYMERPDGLHIRYCEPQPHKYNYVMFNYFQDELSLFQEQCGEFANTDSKTIGSSDQKQLLHYMSNLTALLRKKIEDDTPKISENLLQCLWPHLLRPFPAVTIVQFSAPNSQLTQPYTINKQCLLDANISNTEERHCYKFQTTSPVIIYPIELCATEMIATKKNTEIHFKFAVHASADINQLNLAQLPIYLHGDQTTTIPLFYALTKQTNTITTNDTATKKISITRHEAPWQYSLLPNTHPNYAGYHVLHEYFLFREKFLFISLNGLNEIAWPQGCRDFSIVVNTTTPITCPRINRNNFRLFCTPAINLFSTTTEPLNIDQMHGKYRIIVDSEQNNELELYSINRISSINHRTGERKQYEPFSAFRTQNSQNQYYISNDSNTYYLHLGYDPKKVVEQNISCDVTVCNGQGPMLNLAQNSNLYINHLAPNFIQCHNLTRPSSLYKPPNHSEYSSSLLSHLALSYTNISTAEELQQVLNLYNWPNDTHNQDHIDSIASVTATTNNTIYSGVAIQKIIFELKINDAKFSSTAEIYLFGSALHSFLSICAPINFIVCTTITTISSRLKLSWPQNNT